MGTRDTESGSVAWRGPMRPRETLSGGGEGHPDKRGTKSGSLHFNLPPLPRFHFPGAGLQLPTGLTTYKMAWLASCRIGRGGSPRNTSKRGAETGSPELLAAWRGLAAQESVGQGGQRGRWAEGTRRTRVSGHESTVCGGDLSTCQHVNSRVTPKPQIKVRAYVTKVRLAKLEVA
jgi:hypothetical protein